MTIWYAIVDGDPISSGGRVIANATDDTIEGRGVAYLGNKAWCSACESYGVIVERSRVPHLFRTNHYLQGTQAVSDDGVACKCAVMPRLLPRFGMSETFSDTSTSSSFTREMDAQATARGAVTYDEQVATRCESTSLVGYPFVVEKSDGGTISGRVDDAHRLPRIYTDTAETYTIHWGDEALAHEGWQ